MIAAAIAKSGRAIVLSLSPGPTQLEHAAEISRYAQMWRISNDIWDGWHFPSNPRTDGYPSGVDTALRQSRQVEFHAGPGAWPDADMLPFGSLRPHPGMGEPRQSRLRHEEQRTQFSLWAIARSPLMLGANLTEARSLHPLTGHQQQDYRDQPDGVGEPSACSLPPGFEQTKVWTARAGSRGQPARYIAFFNLKDEPAQLSVSWKQLGFAGVHSALDLWSGAKLPSAQRIKVTLPAHGSAVYKVK